MRIHKNLMESRDRLSHDGTSRRDFETWVSAGGNLGTKVLIILNKTQVFRMRIINGNGDTVIAPLESVKCDSKQYKQTCTRRPNPSFWILVSPEATVHPKRPVQQSIRQDVTYKMSLQMSFIREIQD